MVAEIIRRALQRSTNRAPGLQGDVADEENARPHAEHAVAESQVARHAERGIGHASTVKIIGDVKYEKKWKQPHGNAMPCGVLDLKRSGRDRAWRSYAHPSVSDEN